MGLFNNWPYVDEHKLNLDWVIRTVKQAVNEWTAYHNDMETWKNDTEAAFNDLQTFVTDYFNNLDVSEEISEKLDAMVEDGTLSELLQPFFDNAYERINSLDTTVDALTARMDTFVNLPEGSTTGDAELIDIRVAYNGKTYPTAGDSVRAQVTNAERQLSYNKIDLTEYMMKVGGPSQGITYTWNSDGTCTAIGTSTGVSVCNLFVSSNSLPYNFKPGEVYQVEYNSANIDLRIYDYTDEVVTGLYASKNGGLFIVPESCHGLIVRLWLPAGVTVNETVSLKIFRFDGYVQAVDTASADETNKTDFRVPIQYILQKYGYCRLGPGDFYISDVIIMPEGSTLEGSGNATKLRLMSGNRKVAIDVKKYNTVRNLSVIGAYNDLTASDFSDTSGSRYGIRYYKGSGDTYDVRCCNISNVYIKNFTGSGIYQYGTGGNVEQGLFVTDVFIKNCWCGIYIYANSEYCRYENAQITYCHIACINNGGNNNFSNCVFHAYTVAFKIMGEMVNSGHGSVTNSAFNHIGANDGVAVQMANITNGYVITGNQFWYGSIDLNSCNGIQLSANCFGPAAVIGISGGNTILFNGNMFMNDEAAPPQISISDNTKVRFTNNYGSISGDLIEPIS